MPEKSRLIAGAMSGTSADGVDVAIVRIAGVGLKMSADLILHQHRPYDASLKQAIFALRGDARVALAELARVGREISLAYALCVNDALAAANLKANDLAAVAAHGQTLYHQPPDTIQWLDPALLAAQTGCAVVSDFRRADCAAGGQGAPLVPFADYVLFRHATKNRVLLNIGGIANLTYIPAGGSIDQLLAFDTGPGNCICDDLCRSYDPQGPGYDLNGATAATGQIISFLSNDCLNDPYFRSPPPKSTDIQKMIHLFAKGMARMEEFEVRPPLRDLLATAAHVTAEAITRAIFELLKSLPDEVIVSGGGAANAFIMEGLTTEPLGAVAKIIRSDTMEIPIAAKESIAFALLGAATLDNFPSNVPSCTGANRAVVLGSITPRPYNPAP